MRGALLAVLVLCACARAGSAIDDGVDAPRPDGAKMPDSGTVPPDTAPPPDTPPPPPDTPPCVPMTTQLLANPLLDATPRGTGWFEQLINGSYPIITSQDGPAEHSAPYKAWLGGFSGNGVTDVLYQDVAIPPLTSELVLTGVRRAGTDETTSSVVYDTASVALTQTSGTVIQTVLEMSNLTTLSSWTPFSHTFTQDLSGQTVRLRFTSRNDQSLPTSFFFDTLALTATHGCP